MTEAAGPFGRLRSWGLVETAADRLAGPLLRPAPGVAELLHGSPVDLGLLGVPDAPRSGTARPGARLQPSVDRDELDLVARALTAGAVDVVGVWGASARGAEAVVDLLCAGACAAAGVGSPVRVPADDVESGLQRAALAGVPCVVDATILTPPTEGPPRAEPLVDVLARSSTPCVVLAPEPLPLPLLWGRRRVAEILLRPPAGDEQRLAWAAAFPALPDDRVTDLAARFALTAEQVLAVAAQDDAVGTWADGRRPSIDQLATRLSRPRSPTLASLVVPRRGRDLLVLPPAERPGCCEVAERLPGLAARWRDAWRLDRFGNRGVTALFAGRARDRQDPRRRGRSRRGRARPDGGRPVAARVEVGRRDREEPRRGVHRGRERPTACCSSTRPTRSSASAARSAAGADRYANLEVGYLLQRLERYEGLVILASNLREQLDAAFTRRFHHVVHFPRPGPVERRRLWELALAPPVVLDGPVDLDLLTELDLTGAGIASIVRSAALAAHHDGRDALGMGDLVRAVARTQSARGPAAATRPVRGVRRRAGRGDMTGPTTEVVLRRAVAGRRGRGEQPTPEPAEPVVPNGLLQLMTDEDAPAKALLWDWRSSLPGPPAPTPSPEPAVQEATPVPAAGVEEETRPEGASEAASKEGVQPRRPVDAAPAVAVVPPPDAEAPGLESLSREPSAKEDEPAGEVDLTGPGGLESWGDRVRAATARRLRAPAAPDPAPAVGAIGARTTRMARRETARRARALSDVRGTVPMAPDLPAPPIPPELPRKDVEAMVTGALGHTLPEQTLPLLQQFPYTPATGKPQVFRPQVAPIRLPQGTSATLTPIEPPKPPRKRRGKVPDPATLVVPVAAQGSFTLGTTPAPKPGAAPSAPRVATVDVAGVLARLYLGVTSDADTILRDSRSSLYRGALQQRLKDFGKDDLLPDLATRLRTTIDSIAAQAGIAAEVVHGATRTAEGKVVLGSERAKAQVGDAEAASRARAEEEAKRSAAAQAAAAAGAQAAVDATLLSTRGGATPAAIRAQRDRLMARVRRRLAPEDLRYEREGGAAACAEAGLRPLHRGVRRRRQAGPGADRPRGWSRARAAGGPDAGPPARTRARPRDGPCSSAASAGRAAAPVKPPPELPPAAIMVSPADAWSVERLREVEQAFATLRETAAARTAALRAGITSAEAYATRVFDTWVENEVDDEEMFWESRAPSGRRRGSGTPMTVCRPGRRPGRRCSERTCAATSPSSPSWRRGLARRRRSRRPVRWVGCRMPRRRSWRRTSSRQGHRRPAGRGGGGHAGPGRGDRTGRAWSRSWTGASTPCPRRGGPTSRSSPRATATARSRSSRAVVSSTRRSTSGAPTSPSCTPRSPA